MHSRLEAELEQLLDEPVCAAGAREQSTFDSYAARYDGRVVLFGAGKLGRKLLAATARTQIANIVAFADNNTSLRGTRIDGVPVLSVADAAALHGTSAVFVVSIWTAEGAGRFEERIAELRAQGCETVVPFGYLAWKLSGQALPHWAVDMPTKVLKQAAEIRRCARLWADESSQREFVAQLRWRLHFDFEGLPPVASGDQYFPADLIPLREDESFVDCGAFDGDTLQVFLDKCGGRFRSAVCFEPDGGNCERLRRYVATLPPGCRERIAVRQCAVGARDAGVRFTAAGDTSSRVGTGDMVVEGVTLDAALDGIAPSFLKFDIEGAEPEALEGARRIIAGGRPVIAVCVYHTQDHLWQLPLAIQALQPDYRFFLRPYKQVWELVCYAVPAERLSAGYAVD